MPNSLDPFVEGRLKFKFRDVKSFERFDQPGTKTGQGLERVDFVVEDDRGIWLIEVKAGRDGFSAENLKPEYIYEKLVPKARDTYTQLHLMKRSDHKPCHYIVILDDKYFHSDDVERLTPLSDVLRRRLDRELDQPWQRQYITEAFIIGATTVSSKFPFCQVERV